MAQNSVSVSVSSNIMNPVPSIPAYVTNNSSSTALTSYVLQASSGTSGTFNLVVQS